MSAMGDGPSKMRVEYKALISIAAVRDEKTGAYQHYHGFDPIGMLYNETKKPEYDDMGIKKPVPVIETRQPSKNPHVLQPHDKITVKLSIVSHEEIRSYAQISVVTDIPPTSRSAEEFVVRVRLHSDNVNGASTIIDSSSKDWEDRINNAPYIARRTPGWYLKSPKPTSGKPLPARIPDKDFINEHIRILQIHWNKYSGLMTENLFISNDLPLQPASRAISVLQDIFSDNAGFIEIWVRQETATLEHTWGRLNASWKQENTVGDVFRRFYSAKIQTSRRMGYIDAGSAIVQPGSRPVIVTNREPVTYDLLELTTRLGVGMIQLAEYEQLVVNKLNSSSTAIKLLRIAGAGDCVYTGFLQIGDEVDKKLQDGDKMKISFRPGDTRQDEEWTAVVVPSHILGRSGEVVLDVFRPRVPINEDATLEEKSRPRQFVGLDLSRYTAAPTFESIAEIRSVLNATPSIVVDIKVQVSSLTTRRTLNGIRNIQHGGRQESRPDGTEPWVKSNVLESLGHHILMHDTRIWTSKTNDFLGSGGREALAHLTEEDHVNVIRYLSNVPTDKHGIAVAVVEGYPGVGKTYFLAQMIKALVATSDNKQYLVLAPSNAPADVAALAIHSAVIKDALDAGEVIVRAHSTHTEASYMQSYALQAHKNEATRVLSEDDDEPDDDEDHVFTPPDIAKLPLPMVDDASGFDTLDAGPQIEYGAEATSSITAEGPSQPGQPMPASTKNAIPNVLYTNRYQLSAQVGNNANEITPAEDPDMEGPIIANTSVRAVDFTTLPIDDAIFGKGEAVRLTDEELDSIARVDAGSYNPDGSINVDVSLAEYVRLSLIGIDLTKAVNHRICPGESLVKDPRFQVFEQSLGYWSLAIAGIIPVTSKHTDKAKWASLSTLFNAYVTEGERMSSENQIEFKAQLKLLREFTISTVRVVVTTPVTACSPEFHMNLRPDIIVIDESGRLNRAEYLMLMGHFETKKFMLLGDRMQLSPVVAGPSAATGFLDDLRMSILEWYHLAWWPFVALYVQRRSWKGLMDVVSTFSYRNSIKDGLESENEQKHPWAIPMMNTMSDLFPNFPRKDNPSFYFEVEGDDAIMDEVTKSWVNLKSASMAINIIMASIERGIPADAFGIITAYSAQVDVCIHALYALHLANPGIGYDKIPVNTCDDFQGGQKPVIIFLPVVTRRPGFVNVKGRLTVSISRATDCFIAIGSTNELDNPPKGPNNLRKIFDIARAKKLVLRVPSHHPQLYNTHVGSRAQTIDVNIAAVNGWVENANELAADAWGDSNQQATETCDNLESLDEDALSTLTTDAATKGVLSTPDDNAILNTNSAATTPGGGCTSSEIQASLAVSCDSLLDTGFGTLPDEYGDASEGDDAQEDDVSDDNSDPYYNW